MRQLRVAIATIGCRANQADSASLLRHLDQRVVSIVKSFDQADFVVVNTCCVTSEAERDCRKTTRRVLRASEHVRVLLVGCAVNALSNFGAELGSRVIKFIGKEAEPTRLAAWIQSQSVSSAANDGPNGAEPVSPHVIGRTRALIKVQNGCSHFCSYCIVPKARGKETSLPLPHVREQLERLLEDGFNEIVLTGIQLGAWGKDLPGRPTLADLVTAAADVVSPGRIRLSSVEPWSVDKDLIDAVAQHPRICEHFHIPLQNGDDSILRAMGRGYTAEEFLELVRTIREVLPGIALGTDVMLGFPGETERAFHNTVRLLDKIRPSYVHAFSFSPRPGTRAAGFSDRPTSAETRARTGRVRDLGAQYAADFRSAQVGQVREIIIEEISESGAQGLSDNFVGVVLQRHNPSPGSLVQARLEQSPPGTDRLGAAVVADGRGS